MLSNDWYQLPFFGGEVMPHRYGQVHVKRQRGKLVVIGFGQTPRGQKFIRKVEPVDAPRTADKNFKDDLTTAVAKLFA